MSVRSTATSYSPGTAKVAQSDLASMHAPPSAPLFAEYLELLAGAGGGTLVNQDVGAIGPGDALVVVDMQNDFIPVDTINPCGGAMGVAEGGQISPQIVQLMKHFATSGAAVVATRDYHPDGHCSFLEHGGAFPAHCVQGSVGSHFYEPIGECISELQNDNLCSTVFKGFHENIDSFGGLQYPDDDEMRARVCHNETSKFSKRLHGCTLASWTGSYVLQCSNAKHDVNAPPDVLAAYDRQSLNDWLVANGVKRVFACGLALDFCVNDTVVNASKAGFEAFMILDAARAVHIPGHGQFGSGFVQDPAELVGKLRAESVRFVSTTMVCPTVQLPSIPPAICKAEETESHTTQTRKKQGLFASARRHLRMVAPCVVRPNVGLPTAFNGR